MTSIEISKIDQFTREIEDIPEQIKEFCYEKEFLDFMFQTPMWVQSEDDLKKYLNHIKYRFFELQRLFAYLCENSNYKENKYQVDTADIRKYFDYLFEKFKHEHSLLVHKS